MLVSLRKRLMAGWRSTIEQNVPRSRRYFAKLGEEALNGFGHGGAVQWVVSPGGSASVSPTTRPAIAGGSGATRDGRVLSRNSPSTTSCMKRSCQRHRQVLLLPLRRMISLVPSPSAVNRTIRARHTCFLRAVPGRYDPLKAGTSGGAHVDGDPCAHPADSHLYEPSGILRRTLPSDFIH